MLPSIDEFIWLGRRDFSLSYVLLRSSECERVVATLPPASEVQRSMSDTLISCYGCLGGTGVYLILLPSTEVDQVGESCGQCFC